jgi:predicted nucleic acid-binding Zn ribbon protein
MREDVSAKIQSLKELMEQVLSKGPLREGLKQQEILASWNEIVGNEIAKHSEAVALKDGVLWVRTEASVWAQELSLLVPRIREEFEKKLGPGSVRDVRFHTGGRSRPL